MAVLHEALLQHLRCIHRAAAVTAAMVPVPVLSLLARALAAMGRRPGNALFS